MSLNVFTHSYERKHKPEAYGAPSVEMSRGTLNRWPCSHVSSLIIFCGTRWHPKPLTSFRNKPLNHHPSIFCHHPSCTNILNHSGSLYSASKEKRPHGSRLTYQRPSWEAQKPTRLFYNNGNEARNDFHLQRKKS